MIRRVLFILGIIVPLFHLCVLGQDESYRTDIKNVEYFVDSTKFSVVSVNFINSKNDDLILWLDNCDVSDLSAEQKIRHYFFTVKGDLSFAHIIFDNVSYDLTPILYTSFVIRVKPKETFSFNIIVKSNNKKERIEMFFKERLVCLKGDILNNYINLSMLENYFFRESSIVLLDEFLK